MGLMDPGTCTHTLQHGKHRDSASQELLHACTSPGDTRLLQVSASPYGIDWLPVATHKLTLQRRPNGSLSSSEVSVYASYRELVKLFLRAIPSSVDDALAEVYVGCMVMTRILGKSSSW